MIFKPVKFVALCALPLLLASCTQGDTNKPDEQTFSATTIKLKTAPVLQKTADIPDGWKTLTGDPDSPNITNDKCNINVETRTAPYTGMGVGDDSLTRSAFLTNYSTNIKPDTANRSTITIPHFAGKPITMETYEFKGKRTTPEGDGEKLVTKDTHSFVAIRGFDQPLTMDGSKEKVTPIVTIDYTCTDEEAYDLTTAKKIIESMEFGYPDKNNDDSSKNEKN